MKTRYLLVDEEHFVYKCENCGHLHEFEADGPLENDFNYCPKCGLKIDGRTGWFYVGTERHNKGEIVLMEDAFDYACDRCGVCIDEESPEAEEFKRDFMRDFIDWYFEGAWQLCYEGSEDEAC